ncbi:MAG: extracellular solute-binding protein, partial [Candidatus Thermofonsia bacterium]
MKRENWKLAFVFILLLGMLLAACGGNTTTPTDPEEPTNEPAPAVEEPAVEQPEQAPEETAGVEIRFAYYADGNEAEVMQKLVDDFMAQNPDIKVILDVVPYATIDEQLPVQVETGEGPD